MVATRRQAAQRATASEPAVPDADDVDRLPAKALAYLNSCLGEAKSHGSKVAVLTLSGSLSPVHIGHVGCLEMAAEALQMRGVSALLGFLVPSSDSYVSQKLSDEALNRVA